MGGKRGRAARLARGAHNPKVGSSNLPPATTSHPLVSEGILKALWSFRNLSNDSRRLTLSYLGDYLGKLI